MTKKILLYCRCSTVDQSQKYSLKYQELKLRQWCELQEFKADQVIHDVCSGSLPFRLRPSAKLLQKKIERKEVDLVAAIAVDRLARSLKHLLDFESFLKGHDIGLVALRDAVDTKTPVGRFVFQTMGGVAELERELIRERTKEGVRRAMEAGKHVGRTPWGFRIRTNDAGLQEGAERLLLIQAVFATLDESGGETLRRFHSRCADELGKYFSISKETVQRYRTACRMFLRADRESKADMTRFLWSPQGKRLFPGGPEEYRKRREWFDVLMQVDDAVENEDVD